jgi:hypothetical protein
VPEIGFTLDTRSLHGKPLEGLEVQDLIGFFRLVKFSRESVEHLRGKPGKRGRHKRYRTRIRGAAAIGSLEAKWRRP